MMRNKVRFEYVDELRKINTMEKMGTIQSMYPEDFEEHKQDNAKFIRYKELAPREDFDIEDYLFTNPIIDSFKKDAEPECSLKFTINNQELTEDIQSYHNWSQSLNQQIKERDYQHRFYFKHAQPPPRNKEDNGKEKIKKEEDTTKGEDPRSRQGDSNEEDTNLDLPNRWKYNFNDITKSLYSQHQNKDDKQSNYLRDLTIKNEIAEYRKLKNLRQIQRIGDFHQEFGKYNYYIQKPQEEYHIDFIDNSSVLTNNNMKIDYFRDIGEPSRNIMNYTVRNYNKMDRKDDDDNYQIENIYDQEKRELLYLYFLKEDELKINKSGMNFSDLVNISMGRVTSHNAQMCVRSEKVTKAQYLKLLKKMERYDMRENESGKPKEHKETFTDDIEDISIPVRSSVGQVDEEEEEASNVNIEQVIEHINQIKKEVKMMEHPQTQNQFNNANFNNEIYKKLESLLLVLYDSITDRMTRKYSLSEIGAHIEEIKGSNSLGYDRKRILWFIASTFEEVYQKGRKKPDLRDMAFSKGASVPSTTHYKNKKMINQEVIQTKKIYGFHVKKATNDRSKSPLPKTPLKTTKRQPMDKTPVKRIDKTPVKDSLTATKPKNVGSISYRPTTAKK